MITEAHIVREVENSQGCQWYVYIPKLFGYPNNDIERILYERYKQVSTSVTTNSKDVKNDLFSIFLRKLRKPEVASVASTGWADEETMKFCVKAKLAGVPYIKPQFLPGDVVIVGFEENNMMTPVILGTIFLSDDIAPPVSSGALESICVTETAILPLNNLVLKNSDSRLATDTLEAHRITGSDIADAVQFVQRLKEANIDLTKLTALLSTIKLDPTTGSIVDKIQDKVEDTTE